MSAGTEGNDMTPEEWRALNREILRHLMVDLVDLEAGLGDPRFALEGPVADLRDEGVRCGDLDVQLAAHVIAGRELADKIGAALGLDAFEEWRRQFETRQGAADE